MAKKSKAVKVREYMIANPKASARDLSEKFKIKLSYVYVLRSQMKKASQQKPKDETPVEDIVNHPAHYKTGGIETIDFIECKNLNYRLGNVVKYITRADHKGDRLENLRKARWYLDWEIEQGKGVTQ